MSFLLYGCYGYTGQLIAKEALKQGLKPILAGRNAEKTISFAQSLGLDYKVFSLENKDETLSALRNCEVVLHAAGPFSKTSRQMVDACMQTGTHYLDITGEISVFESLAARDAEAKNAGVMLLPGVGFDVVPSDCLALQLKQALPDATTLRLFFKFMGGGVTQGTAKTIAEGMGLGSIIRKNGKFVSIKEGSLVLKRDFGKGLQNSVTTPWGDVSTAWYSTGIPNIEVYFQFPDSMIRGLKWSSYLGWILQSEWVQKILQKRIEKGQKGPSEDELKTGKSLIIGEAENASGKIVKAILKGPQGYYLTAVAAVSATKKVLEKNVTPGYKTPSMQFGAGFAEETGLCSITFEN